MQPVGILNSSRGVMNGTRADHDQETVILLGDDANCFLTATGNRSAGLIRSW